MTDYRAEQTISIMGSECGTEIELTMVVHYKVHKGYPATLEEPGAERSVEVDRVSFLTKTDQVLLPHFLVRHFTESDEAIRWMLGEADDLDECRRDMAAEAAREDRRIHQD